MMGERNDKDTAGAYEIVISDMLFEKGKSSPFTMDLHFITKLKSYTRIFLPNLGSSFILKKSIKTCFFLLRAIKYFR